MLDPEGSALASDGNARFLVETHGASTRAWDTSAASWQAIEPGVASARLHPEGMALRSLEGEVWAWSAEHGARRVARPALGTTITHLATSDDRVFWHQVRRPPADGEPPAPRGDPPPGGGGGERPDPETPSTEVRWAPHQDEADGAGGLVVTVPFEAVGGASRSRYVLVEAFHDERVHVVDLATAVTTILELPSGLRSKAVVFVGDDGGGDEVAWLAIEGLALVRMTLP